MIRSCGRPRSPENSTTLPPADISTDPAPRICPAGRIFAEIPGPATDSDFALQYYFEPTDPSGNAWIYPGLGSALARPPYLILRQG